MTVQPAPALPSRTSLDNRRSYERSCEYVVQKCACCWLQSRNRPLPVARGALLQIAHCELGVIFHYVRIRLNDRSNIRRHTTAGKKQLESISSCDQSPRPIISD